MIILLCSQMQAKISECTRNSQNFVLESRNQKLATTYRWFRVQNAGMAAGEEGNLAEVTSGNIRVCPYCSEGTSSVALAWLISYSRCFDISYWEKLHLIILTNLLVQEGFLYHHAERRYVMLTCWLPEGPCMLPANASHQVGVGGFVMNDKNEVRQVFVSRLH